MCTGCCAPVLSHCPLPLPWAVPALGRALPGKGRRQRCGAGGQRLPSAGVKVQPCAQPGVPSPGRWEQLLRRCSTLGADELFKVVICQALMSPDRACEN